MTNLQMAWRIFNRVISAIIGLLVLNLSLNHILNPAQSLVAEGIPILGLATLPGLPWPIAFIVGLAIFIPSLVILKDAVLPGMKISESY